MKKKQNISALLGMSQENLALILQVSRSQIAMYEVGKRSLPVDALEKLSTMLSVIQNKTLDTISKDMNSNLNIQFLKNQLQRTKHQQLIVDNKISALIKKQNATNSAKKVISYLLNETPKIKKNEIIVLKTIETKTQNKVAQNNAVILLQLEIKKEVLAFEEKLLQKKLQSEN